MPSPPRDMKCYRNNDNDGKKKTEYYCFVAAGLFVVPVILVSAQLEQRGRHLSGQSRDSASCCREGKSKIASTRSQTLADAPPLLRCSELAGKPGEPTVAVYFTSEQSDSLAMRTCPRHKSPNWFRCDDIKHERLKKEKLPNFIWAAQQRCSAASTFRPDVCILFFLRGEGARTVLHLRLKGPDVEQMFSP